MPSREQQSFVRKSHGVLVLTFGETTVPDKQSGRPFVCTSPQVSAILVGPLLLQRPSYNDFELQIFLGIPPHQSNS